MIWRHISMYHCFNPRPRDGGDDGAAAGALLAQIVSIHAPVMGATATDATLFGDQEVSIHAPVMGATWRMSSTRTDILFQSTPP